MDVCYGRGSSDCVGVVRVACKWARLIMLGLVSSLDLERRDRPSNDNMTCAVLVEDVL